MIIDISTRFIALPADRVDSEVRRVQQEVCQGLGIDVSVLWQRDIDYSGSLTTTHLFLPPDFPGPIPAEPLDAKTTFPWSMGRLFEGETIILSRVEDLPANAARDLELYRYYGIKSAVTFPLFTGGGGVFGAVSFNTFRQERAWTTDTVDQLRLIAQVFANALARKRADQTLRESEARYRSIFDDSVVGIYRATLEGQLLAANPALARILGYDSVEDFLASVTNVGEDIWPSQEERSRFIQKLDEQGRVKGYECRFKRKDGSQVWVSLSTRPFRGPDGRLAYGDGFVEDISERKRAEEALAKSQRLLAETERIGKVGGWEFDLDTMQLTWTPEIYAIHEVDPGYVPTVDQAIQFYTPATRPVIEGAVRRAIEHGEPYDVELELITAKGHLRTVHSIGIADPEHRRVYGFFQDITEGKKAEAALKESEERFHALADSSLVGIYILQDGKYAYVNPAMARVFGYSVAEMTGMTPREIVQPDDHGMVGENIRRRISGEVQAIRYEVKGRYRDGSTRDVEVYGTRLEMNGRPALVGTLIDITDRKQAESALAESEKRYRMLFESTPAGIILIGTDGRVRAANSLQAKLYGYDSPKELEGLDATLFVAEKDREHAARNMRGLLQGAELADRTYTAVRRDGSEFPVEVTSITLRGAGEEVQGYLCLTRDITQSRQDETERIQLRNELTHLSRVMAMGELSTSLAHEINQPLGAILNNAEAIRILLTQPRDKQQDIPEIVEDIIQDAKRAGDVIRKVRSVVKKGDAHLERLQVNALIDEVLALVRNSLIVNNVTLRLDLGRQLADIPGDRVRLQQVLLNLMTNALDAMKETPERTLTVRSAMDGPDRVMVSVGDSGRGIPEAGRSRVFQPFFTTKKDGLGLGLSVCRSIIEEHGGRIWADNNPGSGAVFSFSLKAWPGHGTKVQ